MRTDRLGGSRCGYLDEMALARLARGGQWLHWAAAPRAEMKFENGIGGRGRQANRVQ